MPAKSSTKENSMQNAPFNLVPVENPLSIRELTELLIRHYDLHEGHYDLLVEFQIGVGPVGPNPMSTSPGAMVGFSKIGLLKPPSPGVTSIDASVVNPVKGSRRKKNSE